MVSYRDHDLMVDDGLLLMVGSLPGEPMVTQWLLWMTHYTGYLPNWIIHDWAAMVYPQATGSLQYQ